MVFKNQKVVAMATMAMTFLGIQKIPIVEGKVQFDDEQSTKLSAALTQESLDSMLKAFNDEIGANAEVKGLKAEIDALLKEVGVTAEEVADANVTAEANGTTVSPELKALQDKFTSLDATIKQLVDSAEDDTPIARMKQGITAKIKHSATHLFGSGKEFDAFEGRPWNARAAGIKTSAADYTDQVTLQKLNGDAQLYFRENPTELESLHRDNFGLPAHWPKRLKVDSTVVSGSILTAEITQGRKFGWLPKNKQVIDPEEGKIYPVQIDAQWSGAKLQEIEDSWLNFMNKEGSQPEKWTFVRFLVGEIMKQARVEDRISTVNGIYVKTPDDAKEAGKMINRQNGLFYQLWRARDILKKYRAWNLGKPTTANIYDYLHDENKGMLSLLPFDVASMQGLKVHMAKKYWDAYKGKYKEINGHNMDYKGLPEHPENFPNVEVVTLVDHNNDFIFITFADNIEILENIPAEKSSFKFQQILRDIYMMADYKLGVRLIHIGREINANDPEEFKVQSVWSNMEPIFDNHVFAPVFDNKTGKIDVTFKNLEVHETWGTDITAFSNLTAGQIIKIKGNVSMATAKAVKNNANIVLAGGTDFPLQSGGTLTLYVNDNLKLQELARTTVVELTPAADVNFTDAVLDANEGSVFRYAGTADKTITSIINGFEGQKITIYGNDVVDVDVTLANAATIVVGANAVLSDDAHYIELVKIDGQFVKVKLQNT
jgi:hypothetical protein